MQSFSLHTHTEKIRPLRFSYRIFVDVHVLQNEATLSIMYINEALRFFIVFITCLKINKFHN